MKLSKLHSFAGGVLALALISLPLTAKDVRVEKVVNLESLGEQSRDRKLPILLMFSQEECPYCSIMEESYLKPMLRNREYQQKVIIRQVRVDDMDTLTGFNGERIEVEKFSRRYRAWVTPTLIFLNADGDEIANKLVGIGTEGFFAGDIDNAIEAALSKLRSVALIK